MPGSEPSETQWPARRVRDTYVDFFKGKGHKFWPSSPVVPHNDPTLLFANAGTITSIAKILFVFPFYLFFPDEIGNLSEVDMWNLDSIDLC